MTAHIAGHRTEHEAAANIEPHRKRLQDKVFELLREHPDSLTDDEGGQLLGSDRLTFGRRRLELVRQGLVTDSHIRRKRPGARTSAIVWRLR